MITRGMQGNGLQKKQLRSACDHTWYLPHHGVERTVKILDLENRPVETSAGLHRTLNMTLFAKTT